MSMSKMGITRGRELLRGVLLHRKKGSSSWKVRLCVCILCGVACTSLDVRVCAEIPQYFNSGRLRGRVKAQATGKVLSELGTSQSELSIQWN